MAGLAGSIIGAGQGFATSLQDSSNQMNARQHVRMTYPASSQISAEDLSARALGIFKRDKKKEGKFMEHLKEYFKNNRDLIFSVALIILVDHFVFKGAFREKIKAMVSTFCDKTHKMLENHGSTGPSDAKS